MQGAPAALVQVAPEVVRERQRPIFHLAQQATTKQDRAVLCPEFRNPTLDPRDGKVLSSLGWVKLRHLQVRNLFAFRLVYCKNKQIGTHEFIKSGIYVIPSSVSIPRW